jgi:tetratricopeptide (TPR) repeat protein
MKKRYVYLVIVALFVVAAGFVVLKYSTTDHRDTDFYALLDRRDTLSRPEEWKQVSQKFDELMKISATNPDDIPSRIGLATLYIQEARVTGNYGYYDKAAMRYVNEVLEKDPAHFEALTYKSLLLLSQHHFSDGLVIAEKAREANPYNAFIHGILVDANVELGNYEKAVEEADKMVSIRPDMRSYARISYLREIHGDYPGAIEAMKLAVDAGLPGDEATEWTRVQLGHLCEKTDDLANAERNYRNSLQVRPGYAYALAGLGKIAAINKNYTAAIGYYTKADSVISDYSIKEQLAEVYQLSGQQEKATELNLWVIDAMSQEAEQGRNDDNSGHYADQELAYIYLKMKNYDKALQHALAEYNRRPGNIEVNETVAWMYYSKGEAKKALPFMETALKTKSGNPILLRRAGLIYAEAGKKEIAKALLEKTMKNSTGIEFSLQSECLAVLKNL